MATSNVKYGHNLAKEPIRGVIAGVKNRQSPTMTLMSNKQVPGINHYVALGAEIEYHAGGDVKEGWADSGIYEQK